MYGSRLSFGLDGSVKNANGVKFADKQTKMTATSFAMFVMEHFMPIVYVHKWLLFPKMGGSASCVENVRIVDQELQDQVKVPGGMPIIPFVIRVTNNVTKAWPVQYVVERIDIPRKKK